jgi:DNA-binding transcriptional LysR family regulator
LRPTYPIERFAALPHVNITSSGDDTHFVDDALADHGLARLVSARVPLHSLILMLIGSEAIAVVPRRVATDLVAICPLAMRPLPFHSPRVALSMIWHRRLDNDPRIAGCAEPCELRQREVIESFW